MWISEFFKPFLKGCLREFKKLKERAFYSIDFTPLKGV